MTVINCYVRKGAGCFCSTGSHMAYCDQTAWGCALSEHVICQAVTNDFKLYAQNLVLFAHPV